MLTHQVLHQLMLVIHSAVPFERKTINPFIFCLFSVLRCKWGKEFDVSASLFFGFKQRFCVRFLNW